MDINFNKNQKEQTAKFLLDISKTISAVYIIGGLIPNSPIKTLHYVIALIAAFIIYLTAIILFKET
ncbi:MAG: hypothetical protein HY934_05335 [Candidatus Firestonebacteria bacterium]|nr:hypothetical protein [Candidatus Firestonebacteria bacterium]